MAERRMFAKTIIDSDAFLEMPQSTQLLYFHLSMRGDDDGFINKPKTIMRMVGCKDDDLKLLFVKKFLIPFESGVVVVKHWRIHNYIQNDRYNETKYKEEKAMLTLDENKAYKLANNDQSDNVYMLDTQHEDTQVRLGKGRLEIGKDNNIGDKPPTKFKPPTVEEVQAYCQERQNKVDPQKFIDFYTSKGWLVGKTKMKDWKASVRTWEGNQQTSFKQDKPAKRNNFQQREYDDDFFAEIESMSMKK